MNMTDYPDPTEELEQCAAGNKDTDGIIRRKQPKGLEPDNAFHGAHDRAGADETFATELWQCDGLTTASAPRYPRGTDGSDLLHPEALSAPSNQGRLPGKTDLQKALREASWCHGAEDQEEHLGSRQDEEDRGNHRERLDGQADFSDQHSRHPTRPAGHNDGSGLPGLGQEDQEAAKPTIRPHSGESVALAGTVPQWTALPFARY
ncbi:hypothetical protein NDU88_004660 [Pleurodeles waltl]|uniref:Uncharacterized protein n=1 Tax=Pleurodeles waltl TaxID=8319 RepID=A0AAV7QD71_PLEWA|nr:hypothetical protein NDU88_004660 [Pleurodeles waltl]